MSEVTENKPITIKRDLCRIFDVSPTTAYAWTMRRDFPGGSKGPWYKDQVEAFLKQTKHYEAPGKGRRRAKPRDDAAVSGYVDLAEKIAQRKFDKLDEEARKLKLDNDEKAGLLVPRDDVAQEFAIHCLRIKERLEAMPDELQMEFPAEYRQQWRTRLEDKVRLILVEMAAWAEQ